MLFMESRDMIAPSGKLRLVANEVTPLPGLSPPAGLNYSGGDTVTAAFPLPGGAEIFVAVGRPGEPYTRSALTAAATAAGCACSNTCPQGCAADQGVKVQRFITTDFKSWSAPTTVLYLANGSGEEEEEEQHPAPQRLHAGRPLDGTVWTVKSMARKPTGEYLLAASYGSSVHTFRSATPPKAPNAFLPTSGSLKKSNFKDHDDVNLIHHEPTDTWVDMQVGTPGGNAPNKKRPCRATSSDRIAHGATLVVAADHVREPDVGRAQTSHCRREFCHFTDLPSPSILKHLLKGEVGAAE